VVPCPINLFDQRTSAQGVVPPMSNWVALPRSEFELSCWYMAHVMPAQGALQIL